MQVPIATAHLDIRPFEARDLDGLHVMYGDPTVMAYVGEGRPATREETARTLLEIIESHDAERPGLLACIERESGRLVGRCGFKEWAVDGVTELEIGWMVVRERQSLGLATEQGVALRDYAFDVLDRDHVISVIQPANAASIRVAEKVGGQYWRDWVTPGGQDVVLYRVERVGRI